MGKSSVLRCLDRLLGASAAQLFSGSHVEDVLDRTSPLVIEADLKGFDADDIALFADELSVPILARRHHVDDPRRARGRRFSLDVL